jgi:uncharacterized DUF497 family protein
VWIYEIIWKDQYVEKLADKHGLTTEEVEQVLFSNPLIRRQQKGKIRGEDLYVAYGQTDSGRYILVFFVRKQGAAAMPISARDMTPTERRYYEKT